MQPETPYQLEFAKFPDVFRPWVKDYNLNYPNFQQFPNGRKRREILRDPSNGQSYESYEANVEQIGDLPLLNYTAIHVADSDSSMGDDNDEFDDQFEEDLLTANDFHKDDEKNDYDFDMSLSRWLAYEAFGSVLER